MAAAHIFHKLVISAHLFMKMTSWGDCVLVYNCSEEPFVRPDISGTSRIDSVVIQVWSCYSHFGGGCPEMGLVEKDLSRLLLRVSISLIYILDSFLGQWFVILVFAGDAEFAPRVSGRDDVPTGVETDGQKPGIASCGLQFDVSEVVHSRSRSWELMEQAFDDDNNHVRMRNLLVLFLIGSRFHLMFAFQINSSPNPAATVVHATGRQIVCLWRSVSEVEKAQLLNPLMNSGHSRRICVSAISIVCVMYILCWQSWMRYWISCNILCGTFRRLSGIVSHNSLLFPGWKQ